MSGTPTRLTMRSGRLRSSIVSANDPLATAETSRKPAWPRAARSAARAPRSGSISSTRDMVASDLRPCRRRDRQGLDELDEACLVDRLGDVVLDPELAREVHVLGARARGQHHHGQIAGGWLPVEVTDQLVAVEARHLQIRDDDVDGVLGELLEGLGAVAGGDDAKARAL